MNRPLRFLLPTFYLFIVLNTCAPQPLTVTRAPVSLQLTAADSCGALVEELAIAYEETHPWVTVQVEVFNSQVAERMLREGQADLALLSWIQASTDEEPLWSRAFTRDGIVVIVHPEMPLTEISLAHLQDIFRGRTQEWDGTVLTVVSRESGSGTRSAFDRAVLGIHKVTHTAVVMPSNGAVIEYVAHTPGAIGYVSTLWMTESIADGVQALPVEGVYPTLETIFDGSYPLSRPLYLATAAEPTGEAREFAQWVLGPQGQAIIGEFVSQ
jgi:phosphate transport system substrate-binding protein